MFNSFFAELMFNIYLLNSNGQSYFKNFMLVATIDFHVKST